MTAKSRIIIGDVHGEYDALMKLVAKLPPDVPLTFTGDLIDRGPKSMQVVDFVLKNGHHCVMGNHEDMMQQDLRFVKEDDKPVYPHLDHFSDWGMNGGMQCLDSYEGHIETLIDHYNRLSLLPVYLEYKDIVDHQGRHLVVSHSSAALHWSLRDSKDPIAQGHFKAHTLWSRPHVPKKIRNVYNVYGHTPQARGPTIREHYACIDTGGYMRIREQFGRLTALEFPSMVVYTQSTKEDK